MSFSKSGFLAAVLAFGACVPNPATGVAASGDTLRVQYSSGTGSYVSNDVVSTSVHRDADGNEVGSTDVYKPVEHSFQWHDWKYFQGREELDEHDFYRIAGDAEAADKVAKIRSSAALRMKIGAPLAVVGTAAALLLGTIVRDNPTVATLGYIGGSAVGTAGGLVFFWGAKDMKNRHHLPSSRADRNADVVEDCNEGRCARLPGGHGRRVGAR
jgi:hypothetical protein